MTITTFGEAPLAQYLQEQLGLEPGEELEAQVHLYETLPGTPLGEVARLEATAMARRDGGVSSADPRGRGAPRPGAGLGRAMSAESRSAPGRLAVGQRFYRLVVPGRARRGDSGRRGPGRHRRRTQLHTVLDFAGDRIQLYLFLERRSAQELAASLRKQDTPAPWRRR